MNATAPLFLPQASVGAVRTDGIFLFLLCFSGAILLLVLTLLVAFSIRYRKGSKARRGDLPSWMSRDVEIGWTAATFFAALFIFWWAGSTSLKDLLPPKGALEIHVVAKQWMWKVQHPSGAREIDALHVPLGVPVKLIMTSEDVIHAFYVPAFRAKEDVVPGRYNLLWFTPSELGTYALECSEFCGTDHSRMVGQVVVMPQADYARWARSQPNADSLADQGRADFSTLGCSGCHAGASTVHAPPLAGIYGQPVQLEGGRVVTADEAYLRDSILLPGRDIVAGYSNAMPSFQGVASESQVVELIAYLKSLKVGDPSAPVPANTPANQSTAPLVKKAG